MTPVLLVFYLFALSAIGGGLMTVISRNPVHSVLWLILTFLSASGLFVLLGAEFLAMLMLVVYVGAVAVLFLFVVMMLDVDFAELKGEMSKYLPVGLLMAVVIVMQLSMALGAWEVSGQATANLQAPIEGATDNTRMLGLMIYDQYFHLFQLAGLILLVAMIGAITLTLRHRKNVKRQDVLAQMYRDPAKAMEVIDVKPGEGL